MYILLTYGMCVLLVALASTVIFGVCALVIAAQEGLRIVRRRLARLILRERVWAESVRRSLAPKPICTREARMLSLASRHQQRASAGRLNC